MLNVQQQMMNKEKLLLKRTGPQLVSISAFIFLFLLSNVYMFTVKTHDVLKHWIYSTELTVSCSLKISCLQVSERNRDELVQELSDFLLKNLLTS